MTQTPPSVQHSHTQNNDESCHTGCCCSVCGSPFSEYLCPPCCLMPAPLPPLPAASEFAYKWTSKRALWHNWLAIRNFLELVTLHWMDQVRKMRNHAHTHRRREKWLLFCILMRVISCLLAMADKGTYLCPGPRCLTGGKCPLQRPALIVSEHVVRPIIIIIMGN